MAGTSALCNGSAWILGLQSPSLASCRSGVWLIVGKLRQFFSLTVSRASLKLTKPKHTSGYHCLYFHLNLESHTGLNKSSIVDVSWNSCNLLNATQTCYNH